MNTILSLKQLRSFLITLSIGLIGVMASAQSLSDLENLKVDEMTDAQIVQLMERAEASGISENQLEALATERGMPATEVAKLRARIANLQGGTKKSTRPGERQTAITQFEGDMFDSIRRADPYLHLTPKQKKIFGFKVFHNQQLSFTPGMNIPTPQSYVLGAGDELVLDVYGASEQNYNLIVSPEGTVFVSNVGPIEVAGMTVENATAKLRSRLSTIYSGLSGSNPNTFLSLRLGNTRSIQVNMVGELRRPGTYTLSSFASVFNALYAAGGPNENGSFRNIQVYRNSELLGEIDIYDFLTRGDQRSNIMLKEGDVVLVPPVRTRVEIQGAVRRPGLFEMKPEEGIDDLVYFAGGFTHRAYTRQISVRRSTETAYKVDDIGEDFFEEFTARDGDLYTVGEVLDRFENRVQVSGAVLRPGEFALSEGMTVSDLLGRAGGLEGDAFLNRAVLFRTGDRLQQEVISINLEEVLAGGRSDIELKSDDVLHISSLYEIQEEFYLTITGEVNDPGVYPFSENMTVEELVILANGLKESASNSFIEIARRMKGERNGKIAEILVVEIDPQLHIKAEDKNLSLSPFDHVFVRKTPGFERESLVQVTGEVNYPGDFVLSRTDSRISDVLKRAGGLNEYAYPKGATLIRRTENYTDLKEEERKLETLKSLYDRFEREDSLGASHREKELTERLERRIVAIESELQEQARKEQEQRMRSGELFWQNDLVNDPYLEVNAPNLGQNFEKDDLRKTELIGIELEKILENPGSKYDLILEDGDVLQIPKELQTVRMRGEVLYPTTARYDDNRSFKNYISRAGGFSEDSKRSKSYVIYANGDVKQTKSFLGIKFYPKIEPGAEIIVPAKPDRDPLSPQAWVSIGSGLATMALLFVQLFNSL